MNPISFMGANFVAREHGYKNDHGWGWGEFDALTHETFRPLGTYRERIGGLLDEIKIAGFASFDLWLAHCHPTWATPEHAAIVAEETAARGLRVTSLAGGFGQTLPEFRATCRIASLVGAKILGGSTPVLGADRDGLVRVLREFGLVFALENHPEKSPDALLAQLGDADADVLRAAPDTGWFATQGFPPDEALRALGGRIALVHLKDVGAPGAHDTCALGSGVARIDACLLALREIGYVGPISIEHEPFDRDPVADCIAGRERVEAALSPRSAEISVASPVRAAILGCGHIAAAYARQLATYPEIELTGVFDLDPARTTEFAARHGLRAFASMDELLADPGTELVVNLTIHHAHYETIKRTLEAGKHVHAEKPIATTSAHAHELVELAAQRGLRLGSAPTTWLGEAQQTMWAHLEAGRIGTPRVAYAEINWGRIESWHDNPGPFYAVGPVFDVAVYPLTLLTAWFGPVRKVTAAGGIIFPARTTRNDTPFRVESPDWSVAVAEFESGLMARLTSSFYVAAPNSQSGLEIHGDAGSLRATRWDAFDAKIEYGEFGKAMRPVPSARPGFAGIEFARGARDLAAAIRENRPHRCTGAQAAHVVEVCEAILESVRSGHAVEVASTFPGPAPTEWAVLLADELASRPA